MTYREELEKLTDEELLKKYKYVCERYDWWSTSDDGSEGAFWDHEGQPVVDELKKRGIDYHYELERMKIYDYLDGEIKKSEYQLMDLNRSNYRHIQRDINNERKKIELLKTIKNDLEILELIKERLHHNIFGNLQFVDKPTKKIDEDGNIVIIDDDKYKIMEWLDNDRRRK